MGVNILYILFIKGEITMTTNTTITTIATCPGALENYVNYRFADFIKKCGRFINNHNGKEDVADGLVLTAKGDVCPTFHKRSPYWSLNYLYIEKGGEVHLSTSSVAGVMKANSSLKAAVDEYNSSMSKDPTGISSQFMIIGYYEF